MAGQLDVIGHDGDKIGVAGAQVSILQVTYCIIFPGEAHRFVTTVHIPTGKLRKRGRETAQLREDAAHFRETTLKWKTHTGNPFHFTALRAHFHHNSALYRWEAHKWVTWWPGKRTIVVKMRTFLVKRTVR